MAREIPQPAQATRLQKVLAARGYASRRTIEQWIIDGRLSVNGRLAELGTRVGPACKIRLDGRLLKLPTHTAAPRVLLYHKPTGQICSRQDEQGRPTVFQALPKLNRERWISVGRLDCNTSGLLLLTNNGELAHHLMHPSRGFEREYAVRVLGSVSPAAKAALLAGVRLDDGLAKVHALEPAGGDGANKWYKVVLTEGRNREIRRLFASQGLTVSRLIRTRFGLVRLPRGLRQGQHRELSPKEVRQLQQSNV